MPPIQDAKAALRAEMRRLRRMLAADQPNAGRMIADLVLQQGLAPPDSIAALYWPIAEEVDMRPLINALVMRGQQVVLPCTPSLGSPLIFRRWTPETGLKPGPKRTMEPNSSAPELTPTVIFLPLLAYDSAGRRLGYGGGYYDRTLAKLRARTSAEAAVKAYGVAFAGQQVDRVPTDALDQSLDGVVTERGLVQFRP